MPCKEQSMPKVVFWKLWIKTYFLLKFCFTLSWYACGVVSLDPLGVSVETQRPLRGAKCIQLTTQQSSLEGYDGAMSGLCTGQIAAVMKLAVMKFASSPSWHQYMVESQINGLKSSASTDKSQSFTIVCTVLEKAFLFVWCRKYGYLLCTSGASEWTWRKECRRRQSFLTLRPLFISNGSSLN